MYLVEMSLVGLLVSVELGLDLFKRKPSRLRDQKILEGHSSPSNGRKLQEKERFAKRLTLAFEGCSHNKV